jgi:Na(+)-translocating NADH:ubiquinone oxidoreductase A subunit
VPGSTARPKKLHGGYQFKKYRGQADSRLVVLEPPTTALVPLTRSSTSAVKVLVKPGDDVRTGKAIGRDDATVSSPVLAPVNGRVARVDHTNYFHREVTLVTISGDGTADFDPVTGHTPDWEALGAGRIEEILYQSGTTALGTCGIPTRFRSSMIEPGQVSDVIVHWAGADVFRLSLDVLLGSGGEERLAAGLRILATIMGAAKVHLALGRSEAGRIRRMRRLVAGNDRIGVVAVSSKYPQDRKEILVPTVLGRSFPHGHPASSIGVVVLDVQAALQIADAVIEGRPLIERTVALNGPAFAENVHVRARIGTTLETIVAGRLKDTPSRLVLNSLLAGAGLNDRSLPIDDTFSQVIAIPEDADREFLAFARPGLRRGSHSGVFAAAYTGVALAASANLHGDERPCVQCGYCLAVCPVQIVPALLDRLRRVGINENLLRYGISDCIDCGLCSYVCVSKIPLAANIRDTRKKLVETGCDVSGCTLPKYDLTGLDNYKGVKAIR